MAKAKLTTAKAKKPAVAAKPATPVKTDNVAITSAIDAVIAKLSEYLGGGANPEQIQCTIDELNVVKGYLVV